MKVITRIGDLREELATLRQHLLVRNEGTSAVGREQFDPEERPSVNERSPVVGFVPTMGYLHAGHESLIQRAREQCDIVVLSIYVNPLQFGPSEDLATYPRDMEHDLKVAKERQVDIVFAPTDEEMYPAATYAGKSQASSDASRTRVPSDIGTNHVLSDTEILPVSSDAGMIPTPPKVRVIVSELTDVLCGASRPGHFDGVATVVLKLLNIVQPDKVYFGMKDAQQVAVVRQMVTDFNINVDVVACETLRESDGLAKSSRNVYLTDEERKQAVVLYGALELAKQLIDESGDLTIAELNAALHRYIQQAPLAVIDYVSILSYPALQTFGDDDRVAYLRRQGDLIIALAVKFGKTRLIDNLIIEKTML